MSRRRSRFQGGRPGIRFPDRRPARAALLESDPDTGQTFQLEPKIMRVLRCLAQRPGEVVSKERLFAGGGDLRQRGRPDPSDRGAAPGADDASAPRVIETIRKSGYRLLVPPRPAGGPALSDPPAEVPRPRRRAAGRPPALSRGRGDRGGSSGAGRARRHPVRRCGSGR
jgi:hypothetical protein